MHYIDRKSTRLNSSHLVISYAVFCLKKKINSIDHVFASASSTCILYAPRVVGSADWSLAVSCQSRPEQGVIVRQSYICFFFNDTATTEIYTLSLHDALPI